MRITKVTHLLCDGCTVQQLQQCGAETITHVYPKEAVETWQPQMKLKTAISNMGDPVSGKGKIISLIVVGPEVCSKINSPQCRLEKMMSNSNKDTCNYL